MNAMVNAGPCMGALFPRICSADNILLKTASPIGCSIVVSIPACHAGDRGSIPRNRAFLSSIIISFYIPILPMSTDDGFV